MHARISPVAVLLLGLSARLAADEPRPRPSDPEALRLLEEVARAYAALPAYHDGGEFANVDLEFHGKAKPRRVSESTGLFQLSIAFVRPDRFALGIGAFRVACDGKTCTTAVLTSKRYAVRELDGPYRLTSAVQEEPGRSLMIWGSGRMVYILLCLLQGGDSVPRILDVGDGTIRSLPDRVRDSKRFRVLSLPDARERGDDDVIGVRADFRGELRLIVDPATRLLAAIEIPPVVDENAPPTENYRGDRMQVSAELTWTFRGAGTAPRGDGTFSFRPPPGFERVAPAGDLVGEPGPNYFEQIAAYYTEEIRHRPDEPRFYRERGLVYQTLRARAEAIADFTRAIALDPRDAGLHVARGHSYEARGDAELALADYSAAVRLAPENAEHRTTRGGLRSSTGDREGALADYSEAIRLDPWAAWVYAARAELFVKKADWDRAVADYTDAVRLNPDDVRSYQQRGYAHMRAKRFDQSIADFSEAIRLNPKDPESFLYRGGNHARKRDWDRAIADASEAIRLQPDYPEPLLLRAFALEKRGDDADALDDLNRAIRLKPAPQAYSWRAGLRDRSGDVKGALADYTEALRLLPDDENALYNRGLLYERQGDAERAAADYRKCLEVAKKPETRRLAEKQLKSLGVR